MTKNKVMWLLWRSIRESLKVFHAQLVKDGHDKEAKALDAWQGDMTNKMWTLYKEDNN